MGLLLLLPTVLLAATLASCQRAAAPSAPAIEGLGSHPMPISAAEPCAQRYFDQGLTLASAFDFCEAARAFDSALKLGPQCPM
jgi:hypothetical protein